MHRILAFPSVSRQLGSPAKEDDGSSQRHPSIPLAVVSTLLPTGEGLPILVRSDTWAPMGLALRWAVFARRFEVAESTLGSNLRGLRYLYAWGIRRFEEGLEARLQRGPLDAKDLIDLKEFLRTQDLDGTTTGSSVTPKHVGVSETAAGARALPALLFLRWAISPSNRNECGAEPADARDALVCQRQLKLHIFSNRNCTVLWGEWCRV